MDEYHISNIPQRFLMTQHYQSSMQQPNLDNVQAKLHVARQRNHQLAMQYFRNKYGSAAAYEDFAKKHNMGEIVEQSTPQQILIRHLQMKAKQIQRKVHNQQSFQQQKQQYAVHVRQPQWAKKHSKKANNNPWIKSKSPQKHKRADTESSKYIDSAKAPKNKQSEFISEFKNYLQHKQKLKQLEKNPFQIPADQTQTQSQMNKTSQSKIFNTSKINNNKSIVQNSHVPVVFVAQKKKCYEQELAKKIFKDISGECKDQSKVQKLALVQYIVKNKKILKVLGITESQITKQIMKDYQTKLQSQINLQQFTFFILKAVGKQKQINQLKQQKRTKDVPQGCMLQKQMILHFEKVFKQLDTHTDLIIRRLPYIDRLANDPMIKNQLNTPAVFQPEINRPVTLRRIFQRIQMECLFGSQDQQKVKEYISWNQFLDYFKSGYAPQTTYDMVTLVDSLHKSDAMGLVEVPDVVIDIIVQVIPKLAYKNGYFNALSLIQAISKHPQYEHEKYTQVRQQSRIAGLPSQTLQQVLFRIKKSSDKFLTLKQFLEFFSAKGRPLEQFQQARNNSARKNFSGVKVKFVGEQLKNQKQILDGYDSDPEIYQSKIMNKNSPRKSGRSAKKLQNATSFIQQQKSKSTNRRQYKVTVPIPFSFEQRQRQRSKQKADIKAQDEQKFKQFRAIPIPEKVLQEGLYEKMLQQDKLRIQERRKSCMIMTLANQRPFSFLNRKTNKKTKQQRQQFVFKAKPIPWYCSVDLLQKKKEAQIVRNQKIAKQAQQNLAKAKLPPRMERDFQQKQAKAAMQQERAQRPQSQPKIYREPPNFDKLHRQFQEGLERRRKQNKTTKPQQFNFNQKATKTVAGPSESQQQFFKDQKEQNKQKLDYKKIFQNKPAAPSTIKFEKLVEKRREQMDKKKKEEQKKKKQDQKWQKIDEDLKNKLMAATKNKQNKEQQQRLKRQEEMKQQMKTFQQWKKKCVQKGRNQPMLVQRPLKRDQKIQKMKKLYQISQTLKGNGIKGKDHDSYFKRQQLLMLQDYEVLKTTLNQP